MARRKPIESAGPAAMLARRGEYTIAEAAKEVGRAPDTVRRWVRDGVVKPRRVQCGQHSVSVFTLTEIREMKKIAKTIKPGRKPVGAAPMERPKPKAKKAPAKRTAAKKTTAKTVTPIPKKATTRKKVSK